MLPRLGYMRVRSAELTKSRGKVPIYRAVAELIGISCRRWTRATRSLARIVLYTQVDAQCDKLSKVVGRTSTVASFCNNLVTAVILLIRVIAVLLFSCLASLLRSKKTERASRL